MSKSAFLILSGGYVGAELVAEFGELPPSMLPNGGRPLYEAQCDMADALDATAVLVLPDDFALPSFDAERLEARGVTVVRSASNGTILDSLRTGLGVVEGAKDLYLLFGDTLVPHGAEWPSDSFAAGATNHIATWAEYVEGDVGCSFRQAKPNQAGTGQVVAGFFHFADAALVLSASGDADGFVGLLNAYAAERPMLPVTSIDWFDFGHLFTYHQSRCRELLARSFNSVTSDGHSVVKSGTPARKIFAEAQWYKQMPVRLRPFAPHLMAVEETGPVSYEVEYLYLPLISELYTFTRLPQSTWATMLASCAEFLETMQAIAPLPHQVPANFPKLFFDDMIGAKTRGRLSDFASARGLSMEREWTFNGKPYLSLAGMAERLIAMIAPTTEQDVAIWHGDFHFGNIFYDFRSRRVRVVDPRGLLSNGMLTMYGDARYDISKLGHSIFGLYDFLIADRYHLDYAGGYDVSLDFGSNPERDEIIAIYSGMTIGRYASADREGIAMVALLFLSMLPLHAKDEKRQIALMANAIRLTQLAENAQ